MTTKSLSGVWNGAVKLVLDEDPDQYVDIPMNPATLAQFGPHVTGIAKTTTTCSPALARRVEIGGTGVIANCPLDGKSEGNAITLCMTNPVNDAKLHFYGVVSPDRNRIDGRYIRKAGDHNGTLSTFGGTFFLTRHTDPDPAEQLTTKRELSLTEKAVGAIAMQSGLTFKG